MMTDEEAWIGEVLRGMREAYEARGLRFHLWPTADLLPDFLRGYRPDAIALGPDGGVVIEVVDQRSPEVDRRLAQLAAHVSGRDGWEFRAVVARPPVEPITIVAAPTKEQLRAAFAEVRDLAEGGHGSAAFLTAWSALEALARLVAADRAPRRALSPLQAVQTLAEEGYLDTAGLERLKQAARLRNAIAHGDLSVRVPRDDALALLGDLRGIADGIAAVHQPAE